MSFKDGGPAFPFTERNADSSYYHGHGGMSMRDWFAGQALAACYAQVLASAVECCPENWRDGAAQEAYQMADAMLAAREVKP